MLVALYNSNWTNEQTHTIDTKKQSLATAEQQDLKEPEDIQDLSPGEPLWLYSHGGRTTFCRLLPAELVTWLLDDAALPQGPRDIVLKGCRTEAYAKSTQELLRKQAGYEEVIVYGFAGVASYTSSTGEMTVRVGGSAQEKRAGKAGALAEIRAHRQLEGQDDLTAEEKRGLAKQAGRQAAEKAVRYEAVKDEGNATYVPRDDRMDRRLERKRKADDIADPPAQQPGAQPGAQPGVQPGVQQDPPKGPPRKRSKMIIDSDSDDSEEELD